MEPTVIEDKSNEKRYGGCGFEVKSLKDDGSFEGYGAVFGNVDLGGDIVDPTCFDRTLADMKKTNSMPAMFASHDSREPIGQYTDVGTDKKGLYVSGKLWIGQGIEKATQHYLQMKSAGPKGLSMGYVTRKYAWDEKKGIRTLLDVDLLEVSPTPFPMNPKAKVTSVKSMLVDRKTITVRDAEKILRDAGIGAEEAKHLLSCLKAGIIAERDAEREVLEALTNLRNTVTKG